MVMIEEEKIKIAKTGNLNSKKKIKKHEKKKKIESKE